MASAFSDAMVKLSLVGQDKSQLIDCSDVIPRTIPLTNEPYFPADLTKDDLEQTVSPIDIHNTISTLSLLVFDTVPG